MSRANDIETEVLRRLRFATERLERDKTLLKIALDNERQRADTNAWALRGVLLHTPCVHLTISGMELLQAKDVKDLHFSYANSVAELVLEKIGDKYTAHEELARALRHIQYLEGHAASRGVQFEAFKYKVRDDR